MPQIPFAFQWSISENELLPLKDSIDGRLCSTPVTNTPEFEYFLAIFPNGSNDERRGETWIFLYLNFKNVNMVKTDYTFTIESSNYSKTDYYVYEKLEGWGRRICSTDNFFDPEKKYIIDGKFIIKVNGIFKFENQHAIAAAIKEQKWDGGELGYELWKKEGTKDFTIITGDGGKEIKVHKNVLDARSDVFSAMLNSNMKESKENKITIPDFSFKVIEAGIKLIYECNFISALSLGELMELLQFLDKYNLNTLKAKIEPLLIFQISPSTVCSLTNASILTNSFKLKEYCMEFLWLCIKRQTPLADIDDLDKDVLLEMFKNSLYRIVQTEK